MREDFLALIKYTHFSLKQTNKNLQNPMFTTESIQLLFIFFNKCECTGGSSKEKSAVTRLAVAILMCNRLAETSSRKWTERGRMEMA